MASNLKKTSMGSFCCRADSKTFTRDSWVPYRFSRFIKATHTFSFSPSSLWVEGGQVEGKGGGGGARRKSAREGKVYRYSHGNWNASIS